MLIQYIPYHWSDLYVNNVEYQGGEKLDLENYLFGEKCFKTA